MNVPMHDPAKSDGGTRAVRTALIAVAALALPAGAAAGEEPDAGKATCRTGRLCLMLESDPDLAAETASAASALRLRLDQSGLEVVVRSDEPRREEPATGAPAPRWIVRLGKLSEGVALVTIDDVGSPGGEDVVREVPRDADASTTGRTIALMTEEIVLPYLRTGERAAPLGAGVSIIEPPELGGTTQPAAPARHDSAELRSIGLFLAVIRLETLDEFAAGPRIQIEGRLAEQIVATLGAGWAGRGSFSAHGVRGNVSAVPVEASVGFLALSGRVLEIAALAGFSTGFAIYELESDGQSAVEATFSPNVLVRLELVFHLYGPWALAVEGGASVSLIRDILQSHGREVYRQDRVLPCAGMGVQFWL